MYNKSIIIHDNGCCGVARPLIRGQYYYLNGFRVARKWVLSRAAAYCSSAARFLSSSACFCLCSSASLVRWLNSLRSSRRLSERKSNGFVVSGMGTLPVPGWMLFGPSFGWKGLRCSTPAGFALKLYSLAACCGFLGLSLLFSTVMRLLLLFNTIGVTGMVAARCGGAAAVFWPGALFDRTRGGGFRVPLGRTSDRLWRVVVVEAAVGILFLTVMFSLLWVIVRCFATAGAV